MITINGSNQTKASLGEGSFESKALALDKGGDLWVSNSRDKGFFEINASDNHENVKVKRFIELDIVPYGVTIDENGILWAVQKSLMVL